jgi:putative ABC transport system substrate-binding protein
LTPRVGELRREADKSYRLRFGADRRIGADHSKHHRARTSEAGFQEGTNLVNNQRVGDATAMPGLAQDLILSRPDAIIAFGGDAILAAHKASTTIPIVPFGPDPVTLGLAASLARPGGHVTGVDDLVSN